MSEMYFLNDFERMNRWKVSELVMNAWFMFFCWDFVWCLEIDFVSWVMQKGRNLLLEFFSRTRNFLVGRRIWILWNSHVDFCCCCNRNVILTYCFVIFSKSVLRFKIELITVLRIYGLKLKLNLYWFRFF